MPSRPAIDTWMLDPGLAGKTAIVTGSNSPLGIGAGIARALASRGVNIALVFTQPKVDGSRAPRPSEAGPELYRWGYGSDGGEVLSDLRSLGVEAEAFIVDLSDADALATVPAQVEASLGPVDILINNAAHLVRDSFVDDTSPISTGGLAAAMAVNVTAPAILMRETFRHLRGRGATWGRIVNISTEAAPNFPGGVSYGASKLAMESLSRSAATEMAPFGITVNIVSPGTIQTGGVTAEAEASKRSEIPVRRIGSTDDVAEVVAFLASVHAGYLTGQTIFVGGGRRMF